MGNTILPLHSAQRKFATVPKSIQDEMTIEALSHSLMATLFVAQQAGLEDVINVVGELHLKVRRQLQNVREAA